MFNLSKIGKSICSIKDNQKYKKTKLFFSNDKKNIDSDVSQFEHMNLENGVFQLIPDKETERITMYIAGVSGSGKSYFTGKFIEEYHAIFKTNDIYLLSENSDDPVFDALDYVKKIDIDGLEKDPIDFMDFKDSCVIFDDVDSLAGKLAKAVFNLRDKCLKNGRKHKISVITTNHSFTGRELKACLNESQIIVFFLSNYNRGLKYLLESYLGMSKRGIDKLRKNYKESRWTAYIKPNILIQDKHAWTIDQFEE